MLALPVVERPRRGSCIWAFPRCCPRLTWVLTVGIWSRCLTAQGTELHSVTARVRLTVNAAYNDSPASLSRFSSLLSLLPPTVDTLRTNVPTLIADRYDIDRDALPKTYALLVASILQLNDKSNVELLKRGPVFVPTVPRRTRGGGGGGFLPIDSVPRVVKLSVVPLREGELAYGPNWQISDTLRFNAPLTTFMAAMSPRQLFKILDTKSSTLAAFHGTVDEMTMTIRWANCPSTPGGPVLTDSEKAVLRAALSSASRDAYVYILDSGWPTEAARDDSYRVLWSVISTVRSRLGLSQRPAPAPASLTKFKGADFAHCEWVDQALAEFTNLDPLHRIKVIYVPLSLEQDAGPLLNYLIETYLLAKEPESTRAGTSAALRAYAEDLVNALPTSGSDTTAFMTGQSILNALAQIASMFAGDNGPPAFISESWTVRGRTLAPDFPEYSLVMGVVATGNDSANVDSAGTDFPHRSLDYPDHVAVVNLTRGGRLQCGSSWVEQNPTRRAVGFDGSAPNGCCTSFATPRVAWLLAASQVARASPPARATWYREVLTRLLRDRTPQAGVAGLWLDPTGILTGW